MDAGYQLASADPGEGGPENLPIAHAGYRNVGRDRALVGLGHLVRPRQGGIGEAPLGGAMEHRAVAEFHLGAAGLPFFTGFGDQNLPRGRRGTAHGRHRGGSRAAADGSPVAGRRIGIRHDKLNPINRHPHLFRHGLNQLGP